MSYIKYTGNWYENAGTRWKADIIDTDSDGVTPIINSGSVATYVKASNFWEIGVEYEIDVKIALYSGSGLIVPIYDGGTATNAYSANGTYNYDYTPQTTDVGCYSQPDTGGVITVISIKKKGSDINLIPLFELVYGTATISQGSYAEEKTVMAGFSIEYDAGLTDTLTNSISTSTYTVPFDNSGDLDSFITTISSSEEGRYLMKISKEDSGIFDFYWAGIIQQDFGGQQDLDRDTIELVAVDGLATLKDVDYTEQGNTPYYFLEYIHLGLSQIQTTALWSSSETFLNTKVNWADSRMQSNTDTLKNCYVNSDIFKTIETVTGYNGVEVTEINNMGWYELLELFLTQFKLRLFLIKGSWHVISVELYQAGNVNLFSYTKENYTSTISPNLISKTIDGGDFYRSGGSFGYLAGLKKVRCKYLSKDGGNTLPSNFYLDTTYTTRAVTSGTGNFFRISGIIDASLNYDGSANISESVYFKLIIQVGSYYFVNGGAWSTTAGYYTVQTDYNIAGYAFDGLRASFDFLTGDIPVNGVCTVRVELDTSIGWGATPNTTFGTTVFSDMSLLYIVGNSDPVDYVDWIVENNNNYSLTEELPDSLFGNSGSLSSKGYLITYDGSTLGDSGLWGELNSSKTFFLNQLLITQTLALQKKPLLQFNGDINISDGWLDFFNSISFTYNGIDYTFIPNRISYSDDKWGGDWIEIDYDDSGLSSNSNSVSTSSKTVSNQANNLVQSVVNPVTKDIKTDGSIETDNYNLDSVGGVATTAQTTAVAAQSTADTAQTTATSAQSTADTANATANEVSDFVDTFADTVESGGSVYARLTPDILDLSNLPTSDPYIVGRAWVDTLGFLKVSKGE